MLRIVLAFCIRVYIKLSAFLRNFIHLECLQPIESKFIDWLEEYESEVEAKMDIINKEFKFRPFDLQKVNYSRAVENTYPEARSGHRIVCTDANLYLFGGYNPNNLTPDNEASCLFRQLWKFDLITQQWTLLLNKDNSTLPQQLASHCMTRYGDYLLIYGGTSFPFGHSTSNSVYICQITEPVTHMEHIEVTGELPPEGYGQALLVHQNYLYVVGGTDGFNYTCDIHRLDLRTKVWEYLYMSRQDIRNDPEARYRHELACDDKYLYVIGGGTVDQAFSLQKIPAFDLERKQWCYVDTKPDSGTVSGFPAARKCHSCVQYGNFVVIVGGNDGRRNFRDIWRLDLSTLQWRCFAGARLLSPLYFHDAAISSDGCMWMFGGIKPRNNTTARTNVVHKMFVTIPKLSVIAWESLLFYFPHLRTLRRESLLEIGVPRNFASRIEAA